MRLNCCLNKNHGKLLIKPAKKSVKLFLDAVHTLIKSHPTVKTDSLIRLLNPKLRGWANYFRHVVSKETFSKMDNAIFTTLCRWAKRRHPNRSTKWLYDKYFRHPFPATWWFHAKSFTADSHPEVFKLFKLAHVKIERHIKIREEATPYDSAYVAYFAKRIVRL
jgi:RNA-directed DNA polymerase